MRARYQARKREYVDKAARWKQDNRERVRELSRVENMTDEAVERKNARARDRYASLDEAEYARLTAYARQWQRARAERRDAGKLETLGHASSESGQRLRAL